MLDLQGKLIALAVGAVLAASSAWYWTASYKDATWRAKLEHQRADAAAALATATESTLLAERASARKAQELEVKHVATARKLDQAAADNRRLLDELGMYDPGATPGGCPLPGAPTPSEPTATTPGGCRLSDSVARTLLAEAQRADAVAQWASLCSQFVRSLQ